MRTNEQLNENRRRTDLWGGLSKDFIDHDPSKVLMELSSEFGVSVGEVKKLQKHLQKR